MNMHSVFSRRPWPISRIGLAVILGIAIAGHGSVFAGDAPLPVLIEPVPQDQSSIMDRLWAIPTLYNNEKNPIIQKFAFEGRLHADGVYFQGDPDSYDGAEWRRFRLGAKAQLFDAFTLKFEVDFNGDQFDSGHLSDSYNRFTDAHIAWSRSENLQLKVGKISAPFTLDGATSSKKLLTPERSTLTTNFWFPTEYFTGMAAKGKIDRWSYFAGAYSSSGDSEFSQFDSGYFGIASLGYDFSDCTAMDRSEIRLDYVYSDPDYSGEVGTRALDHIVSFSSWFEQGGFGIWSDIAFASGIEDENQSDLFGLSVMPFYTITETWQLVFRYSYVYSPDDNGVRLNRYENRVETGRCNAAHEWYLGVNTYLYGHKLKWQNGVEYIHAEDRANDGGDYSGWGVTSAIRMYF